jgi:molybdopterin-guanine dinucleotide biosynthesis protein A
MMTLTAVLFVGGLSTRMGCDKSQVEVGGEALWSRQLRLLQQLNPRQSLISCRSKPSWCPQGLEAVLDEAPSRGPLSGLTAALEKIETTHLLALAIDLPRMDVELLRELLGVARSGCGVVPTIDGRFEPLCAVYPREAAVFARRALDDGELSLQKFVAALSRASLVNAWSVSAVHQPAFLNANSPDDLEQL